MFKNLISAWSVAIVVSLSFAASVAAGPLEDGVAAYGHSDFATALRLLRPLAEQGDATAQTGLGLMYENGQGVPQDYAEAVKWYRKAADQGFAGGQNSLGTAYAEGHGVPQDYAEAVKWYQKAADQGDVGARYNLGRRLTQMAKAHRRTTPRR